MREESWIKQYWRPAIAWQYFAVCVFDFIIGPILTLMFFKVTGGEYKPWVSLTLQEGGFYHLSMAAIIGVAAWTRGQEKIQRMFMGVEETVETTTTSQTPTKR